MTPFLSRLHAAIAEATPRHARGAQDQFLVNAAVGNARERLKDLLFGRAPQIVAALEAAKGSVTALDALWEQDCDHEKTKWGRNIYCSRCDEGVRGFHADTAHWSDLKHEGDCIYAHGRALRDALAALDEAPEDQQ